MTRGKEECCMLEVGSMEHISANHYVCPPVHLFRRLLENSPRLTTDVRPLGEPRLWIETGGSHLTFCARHKSVVSSAGLFLVVSLTILLANVTVSAGPSGRPRGLRRSSAAARLQRSWVRIPPGHGYLSFVIVVYCQVEVSATSWLLVQRSPTDCGASCVIWKPQEWGGHDPRWVAAPQQKKNQCSYLFHGKWPFD
jgi:hypothetical protein